MSPVDIDEIKDTKHLEFTNDELNSLSESFYKAFPSRFMTRKDLKEIYKAYFTLGNSNLFVDIIFREIKGDYISDRINFHEFMHAFSVYSKGTSYEKRRMAFNFYDYDKDGKISKNDILTVFRGGYELYNNNTPICLNIDELVENIFRAAKKEDNYLEFEDFKGLLDDESGSFSKLNMFK